MYACKTKQLPAAEHSKTVSLWSCWQEDKEEGTSPSPESASGRQWHCLQAHS